MKYLDEELQETKKVRPSLLFIVILCSCCIIVILYYLFQIMQSSVNNNTIIDTVRIEIKNLFSSGKKDCIESKIYCFQDSDCLVKCTARDEFSCIHGTCKKSSVLTSNSNNKCDPKMGVLGYLIGNTAFGTYSYICKSIDPGIAISTTENLMCKGDSTFNFNYLTEYPTKYNCMCKNQVLIPATSQKREHVECNAAFIDLVQYD